MKGYYKIAILIVIGWFITYLNVPFPETLIDPFPFYTRDVGMDWYVYQIMIFLLFIIVSIVIYLFSVKTSNKLLIDISIINYLIAGFSLIWFLLFFNRPFLIPEFVIKIIVVLIIFVIIKLKGKRGRYNDRIS